MKYRILLILILTIPSLSFATLGGKSESIAKDRAVLRAAAESGSQSGSSETNNYRTTKNRAYTTHEIVVGNRAIHEFVSNEGVVFGVAWYGNSYDHVMSLLGDHHHRFVQAVHEKRAKSKIRIKSKSVAIRTPDLVMENGGNFDSFQGRAFLPSLLPRGVDENEIR